MAGIAEELAEKYNHLIAHCNDCYSSDPNDTELFTSAINEALERAAQEAENTGGIRAVQVRTNIAAAIRRLKGE